MHLLEVKNLSVSFDTKNGVTDAVRNISFHLNKGESVGIVGESGSGKTVTALSMMRLLAGNATVSGKILFNSAQTQVDLNAIPVSTVRNYRGRDLAMIFQEPATSLNPVFTCGNQVSEAILAHTNLSSPEARSLTLSLFEKVKLSEAGRVYNSYPHQLSGGQKQRVMIAMAISCNPSVLLADEPTTALDVTVQASILSLLREINSEKNTGMVFISHDMGVIAEIADRVLVMYNGEIVEEGLVSDIFSRPDHPYTKSLLSCRPPLNRRLRQLPTFHDPEGTENISRVFPGSNEISKEEYMDFRNHLYSSAPIARVKNIEKKFPVRHGVFGKTTGYVNALNNISFDVYPGENLGIVGESGCGKSTLARIMCRLLEPSGGEVFFGGKNLFGMETGELRNVRKDIQIIFQDPYSSLDPAMKVSEIVSEPLIVHKLHPERRKERVAELLHLVGLSRAHLDQYPHEFSGGQRQRICIARALATEPRLLICDECVSSLDVSIQAQILNLINRLKLELKLTCVFITHDLSVVKFMCDRMIVMRNGSIVESGDPDEIYHSPKSDYSRQLIDAIPAASYSA